MMKNICDLCKSIFTASIALLVLFSFGCERKPGGGGKTAPVFPDACFGELWFNVYDSSGKIGYIHRTRSRTVFDGEEAILFRNETFMKGSSGYDKTVSETCYSYDFSPLQEIEKEEGGSGNSFTMRRQGRAFVFQSVIGGISSEFSLESDERICVQPDSLFVSSVEDFSSIKCIDAKYQKIYDVTVRACGKEEVTCETGVVSASKYMITSSLLPGEKITMWIDGDRNECMCESSGLKIVRTGRIQAESRNTVKAVDGFLPSFQRIDPDIAAAASKIKIEILDKNPKRPFEFMSAPYQKIVREKGRRYLILTPPNSSRKAETAPPEALRPSAYIQSDNAAIRKAAAALKVDNPVRTVAALCSKVHAHIAEPEHGKYLSASEAFVSGKGDCTENAVLMAAMARSIGIPSRVMSGFLFNGYDFVLHSWTEVMIGGKWLAVDAAMNTMNLGARYIAVGASYGGDMSPADGMRLVNAVNNMSLDIRSVFVKNKWFLMDKPGKFFSLDNGVVSQKLWGIRFKVPDKWKFAPDESKRIKGVRGDGLIFMTPVPDDGGDIGAAVSRISGRKVESFYSSDMFPRILSDGRRSLLYSSFITINGVDCTCMTYVTENLDKDKMILAVLICPQDKSNFLMSDLDAIDQSLNF